MSFTSPPIIPQTPEQAAQRDQLARLASAPMLEKPEHEAARLRNAIRQHQDAAMAEIADGEYPQARDMSLWAHLPDTALTQLEDDE